MGEGFPLFPEQTSTIAEGVDQLYAFLVAVSGFFSVLIFALIFYFAIRYRRRSDLDMPRPIHGSTALEIFWSAVPFVIVMVMFGWGASLYFKNSRPPEGAMDMHVVGKQWMWKIQHPEGRREINELHVPLGRPVRLIMTSEDVIHSFYVPAFRIKMDVLPGRYTTAWFEATKTGEFHLFCAEYCGNEHSRMGGAIHVMEPHNYDLWLSGAKAGESMAEIGERLFHDLRCDTCHRPDGGGRGPTLDDVFGRSVALSGGETVTADEAYLRESILRPRRFLGLLALVFGSVTAAAGGTFAYVTFSNKVAVIDIATNTVVATAPGGPAPSGVAVTPDGTRVYVASRASDFVTVIDTATNTLVTTVPITVPVPGEFSRPSGVAITPDSTRVYVTNSGSDSVSVIDTATNTVVDTIIVGEGPFAVAVHPDGTRVYAGAGSLVSVIDTANNTVVATVDVGRRPVAAAVSSDGTRAYVTNQLSETVSVIDTANNTVVASIGVGLQPNGVAVTPDGKRVYVPNSRPDSVSVIDTANNTVVATVLLTVGSSPVSVAITPDGTSAYVTNQLSETGTVSVIDIATNTEVDTIIVGASPSGVAIAEIPGIPADIEGPITSNVEATPNPISISSSGTSLTATVDDTDKGGSNITEATYQIRQTDGISVPGGGGTMAFTDASPDSPVEDVEKFISAGIFPEPGVYEACVKGTDVIENVGSEACTFLVVYNPAAGFVSGGGWIYSKPGYCLLTEACQSADGKANFGFISKYKKGAETPTGQTEFQFQAGSLNFHSDSYDWLVIAGARAQYKGSGKINGAGDYGFLLTAIDAQITGGGATDRFRIKIWDKATNALAYDNQPGKDEFGDDATELGGGGIVIHSK